MNVDVIVNGRPWKVAVERAGQAGTFTVTIKGKSRLTDASWIDADTVSLIDGGVAREIRLHPRLENGAVGVEFEGKLFEAAVTRGESEEMGPVAPTAPIAPVSVQGVRHAVSAPMPGRVVRVLIAVGDQVAARQPVVTVEAMKMENELRTPRGGVVKEVLVVPGATVEKGALLVIVEDR